MNKLVFIVDDEQAISKLLSYWLKDKWGYDIEVFASGEEVIKRLYQKPDLILLDIMLPGMDGMEVLEKNKTGR